MNKNDWIKRYKYEIRRKAARVLGDKCVRCGFDDARALQIVVIGLKEPKGTKHVEIRASGR